MSVNISPDELLIELSKDASSRRKRSLEIVCNVCKEQSERGSKDFSPVPCYNWTLIRRSWRAQGTHYKKRGWERLSGYNERLGKLYKRSYEKAKKRKRAIRNR